MIEANARYIGAFANALEFTSSDGNSDAMENLGGLWGSSAVAKSLENLQASYYFYKVENAGHEISGLPMSRNQYDIMSFLSRQVLGDENLAITTDERVPGDTIVRKDFTVQDYILDNLR